MDRVGRPISVSHCLLLQPIPDVKITASAKLDARLTPALEQIVTNRTTLLGDLQHVWAQCGLRGALGWRTKCQSVADQCVKTASYAVVSTLRTAALRCRALIHDISYEGARIVIFDPVEIPNKIKLCIPEKNRIMGATHGVGADGDRPAPLRRSAVKRGEEDGR
jgi:hypothetical protein